MKKRILSCFFLIAFVATANAQVTDTVSIGTGYTNQVWYNLDSNEMATASGSVWDFAFQISGFSSAILANTAYGAELYVYPNGDTGDWSSLDTSGIDSWVSCHNPSTTWDGGAFNMGIDTSDAFDLGWGVYNFINHHVVGDSLFVWKTASGAIKKVWIENLSSGNYNFKIADYNGSNLKSASLAKTGFAGKNFGYYSIAMDSIMDLEPVSAKWDLTFAKYMEFVPTPYSVSGIRSNIGIQSVQVYPVNNVSTYDSAQIHVYSPEINIIGHDWKNFDFGTFSYLITDSTVYFVKTDSNTYWKLVMKGFGGSSNGDFIFEKTKLNTAVGLFEYQVQTNGNLIVYPNPASDRNISLIADLPETVRTAQLNIININGQVVQSEQLQINNSFDVLPIQLDNFDSGIYFLQLTHAKGTITKRLILN